MGLNHLLGKKLLRSELTAINDRVDFLDKVIDRDSTPQNEIELIEIELTELINILSTSIVLIRMTGGDR